MLVHHQRIQHPVGQGFFHSGDLFFVEDEDEAFSYVYDCGSMSTYAKQRSDAIELYLRGRRELDLLYLSHVHFDHVSGVEQLLARIKVKAIVMPLLTIGERIFSYLSAVNDDPEAANDAFVRNLILDPAPTLAERGVAELILVGKGSGGGAPGSRGGDLPDGRGDAPEDGFVREVEAARRWRFHGNLQGHRREIRTGSRSQIAVIHVTDECAIVPGSIPAVKPANVWQLAPYVDDEVTDRMHDFIRFLVATYEKFGIDANELAKYEDPTSAVKDIVTAKLPYFQAAYRAICSNENFTSLSLYSGPFRAADDVHNYRVHTKRRDMWLIPSEKRTAWLGTGDADLKTKKRLKRFLDHFDKLLNNVSTLTVPHHGSENNFDRELPERVDPSLCVVAAARYSDWRHPGTAVVQDIASLGITMALVTADLPSKLTEVSLIEL